jgi:hypothetical protein
MQARAHTQLDHCAHVVDQILQWAWPRHTHTHTHLYSLSTVVPLATKLYNSLCCCGDDDDAMLLLSRFGRWRCCCCCLLCGCVSCVVDG